MSRVPVSDVSEIESDAKLMAAVHQHVMACPPIGPFAYHSAVTLSQTLDTKFGVEAAPSLLVQLFNGMYDVDHLRTWPSLYVAAELQPGEADTL